MKVFHRTLFFSILLKTYSHVLLHLVQKLLIKISVFFLSLSCTHNTVQVFHIGRNNMHLQNCETIRRCSRSNKVIVVVYIKLCTLIAKNAEILVNSVGSRLLHLLHYSHFNAYIHYYRPTPPHFTQARTFSSSSQGR